MSRNELWNELMRLLCACGDIDERATLREMRALKARLKRKAS